MQLYDAAKSVIVLILAAVLLIGATADSLAQGLVEHALVLVHANPQSVELQDRDGNVVGTARLRATVMSNRGGLTKGSLALNSEDGDVFLNFDKVEAYIYEGNELVGMTLSGRGRLTRKGRSEIFAVMATVRQETTLPDCLIWDIPEPWLPWPGEGVQFDTEGWLKTRES